MSKASPFPLPLQASLKRIDGAILEVRRDRWGILVNLVRAPGSSHKFLSLSEAQAAALRDGLAEILGDS